jgi:hypothetical protein
MTEYTRSVTQTDVNGPDRTLIDRSYAALQLRQTGRSCMVQLLQVVSGGSADDPGLRTNEAKKRERP